MLSVSDSLDYSPEKATMVAMYKKMVVGVAILSSPRETYITYLAVKAGWDKAQIGRFVNIFRISSSKDSSTISSRTMLYHLISLNPHKDITLHVSVNSPAMVRHYFPPRIIGGDILPTFSSSIINLDSKPKSLLQDSIHHTSIWSPAHLKMPLCFAFAINDPGTFFGKQSRWISSKHPLPPFYQ